MQPRFDHQDFIAAMQDGSPAMVPAKDRAKERRKEHVFFRHRQQDLSVQSAAPRDIMNTLAAKHNYSSSSRSSSFFNIAGVRTASISDKQHPVALPLSSSASTAGNSVTTLPPLKVDRSVVMAHARATSRAAQKARWDAAAANGQRKGDETTMLPFLAQQAHASGTLRMTDNGTSSYTGAATARVERAVSPSILTALSARAAYEVVQDRRRAAAAKMRGPEWMDHIANEVSLREALEHGRALAARAEHLTRSSLLMFDQTAPAVTAKRDASSVAAAIFAATTARELAAVDQANPENSLQ